jgi:hypothetical protein
MVPGSAICSRRAAIDIHAFAKTIITLDDYLAQGFIPMRTSIRCSSGTLALRSARPRWSAAGALDSVNDASKLNKYAVAHELKDSAVMLGNFGLK